MLIPVAVRSKTWVCGRSITRNVGCLVLKTFCYIGRQMPKCILVPIPKGFSMWDVTCHLNIKGKQEKELKQFIKFRVSAFICK
jgi:hypothetical protein